MTKPTLFQRLLRYGVVGGLVMAVFTGLNWLLGHRMGKDLAFIIAYPPAVTLHFLLNKNWTFGSNRTDSGRQVSEYLAMVFVTFVIQAAVFKVLSSTTTLPGWAAAGAANAAQMAITFFVMQYRIFTGAPAESKDGNPKSRTALLIPLRLAAILVVSFALRIWLATGGGQGFWPDESRFDSARLAAASLRAGRWRDALVQLFGHADHVLFRLMSLPAAVAENALGVPRPVLVSAYFSLFSVGAIFLIWAIARRVGASEREALWAAFLAATSNCLFFYSRHYLPYDPSLFLMLLGLWVALGPDLAFTSVMMGSIVAAGFLTYNGYWLLGGCVIILHVAFGNGGHKRAWRRAIIASLGFTAVTAAVVALGAFLSRGLLAEYRSFSASIRQGDFHVGYRVIPEYLWYAEGGMLAVWMGAILYAICARRSSGDRNRMTIWISALSIIGAGLIFFSDVVPKFMVYGRLTRELVPFACLGAGVGIARFLEVRRDRGRIFGSCLGGGIILIAAVNFETPLIQVFPDRFRTMAVDVINAQRAQGAGYCRILFAEPLWGKRLNIDIPPHAELLRYPHPMQFRPFQYEGFSKTERSDLNKYDVAMQVVDIPFQHNQDSAKWGHYTGPLRMKLQFQPDFWGESEPLVVTGVPYKSDLVYVTYLDQDHISIGVDHWSSSATVSDPIRIDYSKAHEILITEGSLVPPRGDTLYKGSPELEGLCDRVVVLVDGFVVISRKIESYPSGPETCYWGINMFGASTTVAALHSSLREFGAAPLDKVAAAIPSLAAYSVASLRAREWSGAVGPVRIKFTMAPPSSLVSAEPLMSIDGPGTKDVLFITRSGTNRVRLAYDRKGAGAVFSEPMELSETGMEEVDVSAGSLLPPSGAPIYARYPDLEEMREALYVRFNNQPAIRTSMPFLPVRPQGVTLGSNTIGSSSYPETFRGVISYFGPIGPENMPGLGSRLSDLVDNDELDWLGFSGPVRLRVVFPLGQAGHREPLLISGATGSADGLFVEYDSDRIVRLGYARSGAPAILSPPTAIIPGQAQEILLDSAVLMPPGMGDLYLKHPELASLAQFVHIGINGVPVLHEFAKPFPAPRTSVWVGDNPLAIPSIDKKFQGTIQSITRAHPMDIYADGNVSQRYGLRGWDGYPGALRIKCVVPAGTAGFAQPIVTTGLPGIGDVIFLRYADNGEVQIGHDHWGSQPLLSDLFPLSLGEAHTITVSFGGLFPPDGPLATPRKHTSVMIDGRKVLDADDPSHPSVPANIMIGLNMIGASTAKPFFTDVIDSVESVRKPAP